MADLNTVAMMCIGIKMIATRGSNVDDVLLASVAEHTERLLMTAVMPAHGDVVKDWLMARAELLSCRLSAL